MSTSNTTASFSTLKSCSVQPWQEFAGVGQSMGRLVGLACPDAVELQPTSMVDVSSMVDVEVDSGDVDDVTGDTVVETTFSSDELFAELIGARDAEELAEDGAGAPVQSSVS